MWEMSVLQQLYSVNIEAFKMKENELKTADRINALEREVKRLRQEKYILEQQLNMKEGQLRLILEESPVVLTSILKDGTIELSIGKGLEELGLTAATLVGRNVEEAFSSIPIALRAVRKALAGAPQTLVLPFRPDLWMQNHYIPIRNEENEVERVYAVSLDVSTVLVKYHKHQLNLEKLPDAMSFTPSGVAVFDKELNCIFLSEKWREDFLTQDIEMLNQNFYDMFPGIPERWKKIHQRTLKGHIEWAVNDYFCTQEGITNYVNWRSMPWYEGDGTIGGFIVLTELACRIDKQGNIIYSKNKD